MNPRCCLFNAGYFAQMPAIYFSKKTFAEKYTGHESAEIGVYFRNLMETVESSFPEAGHCLDEATKLAERFQVQIGDKPTSEHAYSNWIGSYIENFERQFPMTRIDHYYFLFGRKLAEIIKNTELLICFNTVLSDLGRGIDLSQEVQRCTKDNEFILFKLMAGSVLLSSEPRHGYFNSLYRQMCQEFELIKSFDFISGNIERNRMQSELRDFEKSVTDGFEKCCALLKELDV